MSLVLLCCFILGGMMFKFATPPKCESLLRNDNIFVLAGDSRRIPYALKKLETIKYGRLYIIGAGTDKITNKKFVKVESKSKSTYQNALAVKQIVKKRKLKRLVVVTTEDHMNRSLYLLRNELPETEIIACPASLSGMSVPIRVKHWAIEYLKYILTLFGIKEG